MKKIVLTLSIGLFLNSAFALDPAFKSSLAPASHSNYHTSKIYPAEKIIYNAFYNAEGEMVTAFRHILSSDLPMNLMFSLKKYNKNMWVTDVVEVLNENKSTSYFVNLQNADEKITLKSRNGNKWKIQKN